MIRSLDFNPTGEYVATIDGNGVCLVSDVTTINCRPHKRLGYHEGLFDSYDFFLPHENKSLTS